jgi:hypothetical protein
MSSSFSRRPLKGRCWQTVLQPYFPSRVVGCLGNALLDVLGVIAWVGTCQGGQAIARKQDSPT